MIRAGFLPALLLPIWLACPAMADDDVQVLVDSAQTAARAAHYREAYDKAEAALQALESRVKWNDVANLDLLIIAGDAALALNNRTEAEAAYRQVEERTRLLAPHPDQRLGSLVARAQAFSGLASLFEKSGKVEAAEPLLRKAFAIASRNFPEGDNFRAQIAAHLANVLQTLGKTDDAQALLRDNGTDEWSKPLALKTEALAAQAGGDIPKAIALLREAVSVVDRLQPGGDAAVSFRTDLGNMQIATSQFADAETTLRAALAVCGNADCDAVNGDARASLAYALAAQEKWDDCYAEAQKAAAYFDGWISSLAPQDDRSFDAQFIHDLVAVSAWHVMQAHPDQQDEMMAAAFTAMQMNQSPKAASALLQMAARAAAGDPTLAEAVRVVQDQQADFAAAEGHELAKAGSAGVSTRLLYSGSGGSLHAKMRAALAGLEARFPGYTTLAGAKPLALDDVPPLLGNDQALVIPYVGRSQIDAGMVWVITNERIWWQPIDTAGLLDKVAALRKQLDPRGATRGVVDASGESDAPVKEVFDAAPFVDLYQLLLGGVDAQLLSRKRLIIVPSPALAALPFEALARAPATEPDDPRTVDWLIRHVALSVLPSVASLRSLKDLPPDVVPQASFAGFGDPLVEGSDLAALPGSAKELQALAASLKSPGALYLAEQATPDAVRHADLQNARVLAFATHGLLPGGAAGLQEPALVLSPDRDGNRYLTASDVAQLRLNADFVILSACNTAGGDAATGEGFSGLARAFIYAGARALLVSHWPVYSDAAVVLTTGTVKGVAEGLPRDVALQQAMLAILDHDKEARHWRPDYWAPFALIGAANP